MTVLESKCVRVGYWDCELNQTEKLAKEILIVAKKEGFIIRKIKSFYNFIKEFYK